MKIEEVFKQGLKEAKLPVSQDLWSEMEKRMQEGKAAQMDEGSKLTNKPSKISHTGKGLFKTLSSTLKAVMAVTTVGVVGVGALVVYNNTKPETQEEVVKTMEQKDNIDKVEGGEILAEDKIIKMNDKVNNTNENTDTKVVSEDNKKQDSLIFDVEDDIPQSNINTEEVARLEKMSNDYQPPVINQQNIIKQYRAKDDNNDIQSKTNTDKPHSDIKVKIPNVITPDGDGVNDCFSIVGLEAYPDNTLVIYDRRGKAIFKQSHYDNDFCGQNAGSGAYFYSLTIRNGGQIRQYNGSLSIIK